VSLGSETGCECVKQPREESRARHATRDQLWKSSMFEDPARADIEVESGKVARRSAGRGLIT